MKDTSLKIISFSLMNIIIMFGFILMLKQAEDIVLLMDNDNYHKLMSDYFSIISILIGFSASFLSQSILTKIKITKTSNSLREQINNQKNAKTTFTISLNYTLIQAVINSAILIFLK